ncbi:MAG: transglutaminase family protein [Verrucomicrobiales bacterium]|nr:transglutaminase family protein [Verrucomicrobiales bacterium]
MRNLRVITLLFVFIGFDATTSTAQDQKRNSSKGDNRIVKMEMRYTINVPGKTRRARFLLLVPSDLPYRQRIINKKWILPPTKTYQREGGTEAEWIFDKPKPKIELGCILTIELFPYDFSQRFKDKKKGSEGLKPYLKEEKFLEKSSPSIISLAKVAAPKREVGEHLLQSLFNGTLENLKTHGFVDEVRGADLALELGGGDCTDFTDVLVTLCRVRGLPARHIRGVLAGPFARSDTPKHSWAEVYIPKNGWIRLDPYLTELGQAGYKRLKNHYITLSYDRNDEIGNYWRYWSWGAPISVTERLDCGHGVFTETVGASPKK